MHELVATITIESLGKDETLVLHEEAKVLVQPDRHVETEHGLDIVVDTLGEVANLNLGPHNDAEANHGIDGERIEECLIVHVEEGGIDVPKKLGTTHVEGGGAAVLELVVARGHYHVA